MNFETPKTILKNFDKMGNTIDLQIQSTASDGKLSSRDLVFMAKDRGLLVVALTDHDTVDGVPAALEAAKEAGIRVIPGIEISVDEHQAHILGYGFDHTNKELAAELEKSRQGRIAGAKKMVENLQKAGFAIDWEDVLKQVTGSTVARPHLARALLSREENKEKLGHAVTTHDVIEKFLTDDNPNYVPRTHIKAKEAIALIRQAGGVAVWSHPAIHFYPARNQASVDPQAGETSNGVNGDYEALEKFLIELIGWGIGGIEVFNPSHAEDDVEFLFGLAEKYNLLRTAGSDFHYLGPHTVGENGLKSAEAPGDYETYGFPTDGIIEELDKALALAK